MASHTPITVETQHFKLQERFTVVVYYKASNQESVILSEQHLKTMETIPPTQDAQLQHCKRVACQAGIWTTSDLAQQQTTPEGHGWTTATWLTVWTTPLKPGEVWLQKCERLWYKVFFSRRHNESAPSFVLADNSPSIFFI